jgi:hypothetical protein
MRSILASMLFSLSIGCVRESSWIQHISQIETRSRGVEFTGNSDFADIGMLGNTCRFDFRAGAIGADADFAQGEDDVVLDSFDTNVVIKGSSGVYIIDDWMQTFSTPDTQGSNVVTALLTSEGYATVAEDGPDCKVTWRSGVDSVESKLNINCPDINGLSVDRLSGTVFLSTEAGTLLALPEEVKNVGSPANLIKWDSSSRMLYTSDLNSHEVTAVGLDGAPKWVVETEGAITSIDDMGPADAAVVMTRTSTGGEILVIDSATGTVINRTPTPAEADRVITSPDGRTLAVVLENEVHFFSINN